MDLESSQIEVREMWNPLSDWCYRDILKRLWLPTEGLGWTVLALVFLSVAVAVMFVVMMNGCTVA